MAEIKPGRYSAVGQAPVPGRAEYPATEILAWDEADATAVRDQAAAVRSMLATGESRQGVATRPGISTTEIGKHAKPTAPAEATNQPADSDAATASDAVA
jgi:DNA invertase Pin-like site-specific DNA recombinase